MPPGPPTCTARSTARAKAGKDTPYYSPYQKLAFGILQGVRCLYAVLLPLAFVYRTVFELEKYPCCIQGPPGGSDPALGDAVGAAALWRRCAAR